MPLYARGPNQDVPNPPPGPAVPSAPPAPTLTAASEQVTVEWSAPFNGGSSITGYKVRHRTTAGPGSWTETSTLAVSPLLRVVSGLTNGTGYDFGVQAINAVGAGAWSANASATPVALTSGAPVAADLAFDFTGTFPTRSTDWHRPAVDPNLYATAGDDPLDTDALDLNGATSATVAGQGTWAVEGTKIAFYPVEKFTGTATRNYRVRDSLGVWSNVAAISWTFDPFYWDGPLARGSAPSATTTVAPSGLQAAIDAASPGHVIHVSDGTHGTRITLNKAVTVWSVTKWGAKFSQGFVISAGATVDGVEVTGTPSGQPGIDVTSSGGGTTLRHVKASSLTNGQYRHTLRTTDTSAITVESCEFYQNDGSALNAAHSADATYGNADWANIRPIRTSDVMIRNTKVSGSMNSGISFETCTGPLTVEHCWVENARKAGVLAHRSRDLWVMNSRILNVGMAGIFPDKTYSTSGGQGHRVEFNTIWAEGSVAAATDRNIDSINPFMGGGIAGKRMSIYKNRSWHVGHSSVGTGGVGGDHSGGYQDWVENIAVDMGQVGFGIYGGHSIHVRRNKIINNMHSSAIAGAGQLGTYVWKHTSHTDTTEGYSTPWGSHVHDQNRIYFRRPNGTFNNAWVPNPEGVTGMSTNFYGNANDMLGMSSNTYREF